MENWKDLEDYSMYMIVSAVALQLGRPVDIDISYIETVAPRTGHYAVIQYYRVRDGGALSLPFQHDGHRAPDSAGYDQTLGQLVEFLVTGAWERSLF